MAESRYGYTGIIIKVSQLYICLKIAHKTLGVNKIWFKGTYTSQNHLC